jgi:predicted site-specific integrase-resolvase
MKTVTQCAKDWGVTRATVYNWARAGRVAYMMLPVTGTMVITGDRPDPAKRGRPRKKSLYASE